MLRAFFLNKQHLSLAAKEVEHLAGKGELLGNILICKGTPELKHRLGLCHSIHEFLFKCNTADLEQKAATYDWSKIYKGSLCVRAPGLPEKRLADLVYRNLGKPKIDLKNPVTMVSFFKADGQAVACRHLADVDKSYHKRKAHLRPALHPTSMHPGLIRACINLTGLMEGSLLDPFCGSGGILIEAGLMGFDVTGCDIDRAQVARARKNLDFYNVDAEVEVGDALKLNAKADCIVTDLPYGKASKAPKIKELYPEFFSHARKLTRNLVVILPSDVNYGNLLAGWRMRFEYSVYVHRSLTRRIICLSLLV